MMKDKQDPFSGMSLEELWQMFPVFLTEHRPVWAQWYQEEGKRLLDILSMEDICEISHVGSTSIPSIWAKPIVDILVEIREGADMQAMKEHIIRGGYICMMEKAGRISFNRGYTPSGLAEKVFHLHLREAGDNDELYFRDYMREHPEAAREYEALKLRLWKEYEYDRDGYTEQKTVMVARFTGDAKTLYPGRYKRQALEFARAEPEDTKRCAGLPGRRRRTGDMMRRLWKTLTQGLMLRKILSAAILCMRRGTAAVRPPSGESGRIEMRGN